jgi:NADH-quinone oxidoreductase subunit M
MWESAALSVTVFLPLVGAAAIALIPHAKERSAKPVALAVTLATFALSLLILASYYLGPAGGQGRAFIVDVEWIPVIGAGYRVAIDGISMPLFVLTNLLTLLCVVYCFHHIESPGRPRAFLGLILLLQTGMAGTFIAFDLILFFVFWELVLVPMYFLIGIWGGPHREYAAVKFFLYTMFGSMIMLVGFIALYFGAGAETFSMVELTQAAAGGEYGIVFQRLVFLAIFLGLAIKVPMWPFHTWLPDAHTEAPTVGSVLLAGIMLKMGTYGFVRIAVPMLPDAAVDYAPFLAVLAVIAILYGALCCMAQTDLKRLIAFSSVGHMGFVMLGIAALTTAGVNAAIFGMVAHGLITGMLFFVVGSLKHRYHTSTIADIGGGVLQTTPRIGAILTFVAIASLGLPPLPGFWGEVVALYAAFNPAEAIVDAGLLGLFRVLVVFGAIGTLLTAGYFLTMLQRVTMGTPPRRWVDAGLDDVSPIELGAWTPLLVTTVVVGLVPLLVFGITRPDVSRILTTALTG